MAVVKHIQEFLLANGRRIDLNRRDDPDLAVVNTLIVGHGLIDPILRIRIDGDGWVENVPDSIVHVGPLRAGRAIGFQQKPACFLIGNDALVAKSHIREVRSGKVVQVGMPVIAGSTVMVVVIAHSHQGKVVDETNGVGVGRDAVHERTVEGIQLHVDDGNGPSKRGRSREKQPENCKYPLHSVVNKVQLRGQIRIRGDA